ncbi:MAG: response regulator, partial [Nitrospinae bacterium]|nr:response regulator [Nitrospinota bacterium]
KRGYEAVGFTSGAEALEALKAQTFDLLLTDLMMPEMDGLMLLRAALGIDPHLVGLMMTGQGTVQTAVEAMKAGAFDYVLKPFKLQVLLPTLSRAMDVRRLRQENLQLRETVAMYELTQAMAHTLDFNTILHKIADAAVQQCEADEASIMLPTNEGNEFYIAVVRGEHQAGLLGERVPSEQGIAGWVGLQREPLLLQGEVHDPRFAPLHPRPDILSAISLPLEVGGRLVGILNVNATQRRPFSLGQIKALRFIANSASSALEAARLHAEVQQAEAKYRSIFEQAIEGIFQSTLDGRFITVNPAMAHLLGYDSCEELKAAVTNIDQQLYVDSTEGTAFQSLLAERGVVQRFEAQLASKDGRVIWASISARVVRDPDGTPLYIEGTAEDITERRRVEEELKRQQETLYQAEKLATMGQLLAGVAHELNNPLSVVLGQSDLLRESTADITIATRAEKINQAASRCARIVKNFLALARQHPPERQKVQLNQIVREAVELLAYPLRVDGVEVCFDLEPDLPVFAGDPHQLHQVVVNLVSNAQQAMHDQPPPRRLTIRTQFEPAPGRITLSMADTGPGIPKGLQAKIFEPFFTTKPQGVGTGLGLPLCQGIIEGHGGVIRVVSQPGQGAMFRIELPMNAPLQVIPQAQTPEPLPTIQGKAILVVDDESEVAGVLAEILSMEGHQVETATSGLLAWDLLQERPFDLILSDLRMPGLDGPGLYQRLEQHYPWLCRKVIFLTGDTLRPETRELLERSAAPMLNKPFAFEEVRRIVQRTLQGLEAEEKRGRRGEAPLLTAKP